METIFFETSTVERYTLSNKPFFFSQNVETRGLPKELRVKGLMERTHSIKANTKLILSSVRVQM